MDLVLGTDVLCGAVVGDAVEEDARAIGQRAKQMAALKNVTVSIARSLLRGGQAAIVEADKVGTRDRENHRANIRGHLQWHRDALDKAAATPDAVYASADDLKKWVLESYIEANVAREGRARAEQIWSEMWREIGAGIADYARRAGNVLAAPFLAVESAAKVSGWVWAGGIAAVVGLVGYGAYRVLLAAAPGAGQHVARRYLP